MSTDETEPSAITQPDQWRMSFSTIAGDPPVHGAPVDCPEAMITLDFKLFRRVVVPLNQSEELGAALRDLGLDDVADLLTTVKNTPPRLRKYFASEWTSAVASRFESEAIARICHLASEKITWEIEGSFARGSNCIGIVSCGGYELRIKLSRENLLDVGNQMEAKKADCEATLNDQNSSAVARQSAGLMLKIVACVGFTAHGIAMRDPQTLIGGAYACFDAYDQMMNAKDAAEKQAAADAKEKADRAGCHDGSGGADGEVGFRAGNGFVK